MIAPTDILVVLAIALHFAIAGALVYRYLRIRDGGLVWLGVAVVIWPLISELLQHGERILIHHILSGHPAGFFPFSLAEHGQMTYGSLFTSLDVLRQIIGLGLLLIAVFHLSKTKNGHMPITASKELLTQIDRAEKMHNFVLANVPNRLMLDTDEKTILVALFSLAIEHHGAILQLLKSGRFDGSAMALNRPLIDCVYRALWLHCSGKPEHFASVRAGGSPYPGLPNMADAIDKGLPTADGIFQTLKPFINALHGYTHGGLEQLGRRFDSEGNVRATYTDGERFEVVNATTAYIVMFAVAWCQIYAGGDPVSEPRSAEIMRHYSETYGAPTAP